MTNITNTLYLGKPHDPQDKPFWYEDGERGEAEFVEFIAPRIGISAQINPEKVNVPWAIDLIVDGRLADLKRQTTPFFTAQTRYGMDARLTATFNQKDAENYRANHPDLMLYFWLHWPRQCKYGITVPAVSGVWRIDLQRLLRILDTSMLHVYRNRGDGDDRNNATASWLVDLTSRGFELLYFNGYGHGLMVGDEVMCSWN